LTQESGQLHLKIQTSVLPSVAMFPGVKSGELSEELVLAETSRKEGQSITPSEELGVEALVCQQLVKVLQPVNTITSVVTVATKLLKCLLIMQEELLSTVDETAIKEAMSGLQFDDFQESACAVRFMGVKLVDSQFDKDDRRREPYKKIVTDLCAQYVLPEDVKQNMLNGELAKESHQVNFEFKFTKGKPGQFYFGKFMAQNTEGTMDMVMLFYRLGFKFSPHIIKSTYAQKFLWFTVGTKTILTSEEKNLTEEDTQTFKTHFRLKMFKELAGQIKVFALEDEA